MAPKGTPKRKSSTCGQSVFKAAVENPDLLAQLDAKGTDYQLAWGRRTTVRGLTRSTSDYEDLSPIAIGMWTK